MQVKFIRVRTDWIRVSFWYSHWQSWTATRKSTTSTYNGIQWRCCHLENYIQLYAIRIVVFLRTLRVECTTHITPIRRRRYLYFLNWRRWTWLHCQQHPLNPHPHTPRAPKPRTARDIKWDLTNDIDGIKFYTKKHRAKAYLHAPVCPHVGLSACVGRHQALAGPRVAGRSTIPSTRVNKTSMAQQFIGAFL